MAVKGGLGRGLSALFGDDTPMVVRQGRDAEAGQGGDTGQGRSGNAGGGQLIDITRIVANPNQPRQAFEPGALSELAESIRLKGVLQPILVRPVTEDGREVFQIVAGERRWRASQLAGLTEIPALVRELTEAEAMAVALIENLQREDLNPIEEALGCQRLIDEFGLTQEELARQLSKSRSTLSNALRLLTLPEAARQDIQEGRLTAGHGRALMSVSEEAREAFRQRMGSLHMSVRQAEGEASYFKANGRFPEASSPDEPTPGKGGKNAAKAKREPRYTDEELKKLKTRIDEVLGLKVTVSGTTERGVISFHFQNPDELARLAGQLQISGL
jgi:ParB family chromosome partitioning protein